MHGLASVSVSRRFRGFVSRRFRRWAQMAGYPPTCFAPQITQITQIGADGGLYAALSAAFVFCPADGRQVCQDGVWHAEYHFYLYNINIWLYFCLQISPFSCNFAFAKLKSLSLTPPSPGGVFPFVQMPPPTPETCPDAIGKEGLYLLPKGVRPFCLKGCDPFAQRGTDLLPKGVRPFCPKGCDPFA